MIFTVNVPSSCNTSNIAMQGYATYNSSTVRWDVDFDSANCPKLFEHMQAPSPVHLGGVRYKLYFGDPSVTDGRTTTSTLPWLGPKKLMYADGTLSGESNRVDYEDWEDPAESRAIRFLWPDGTELTNHEMGYIDDFQFLTPTGDLDFQVAYLTVSEPDLDRDGIPKDALALLVNP